MTLQSFGSDVTLLLLLLAPLCLRSLNPTWSKEEMGLVRGHPHDTSAPFSVTAFQLGPAGEEVEEAAEEEEEEEEEDDKA